MARPSFFIGVLVATLSASAQAAPVPGAQSYAASGTEASSFVLPPDATLVKSLLLPSYGLTYERYQQHVGPAAVLGGQLTLFKDASGAIVIVIGSHYTQIALRNSLKLS